MYYSEFDVRAAIEAAASNPTNSDAESIVGAILALAKAVLHVGMYVREIGDQLDLQQRGR